MGSGAGGGPRAVLELDDEPPDGLAHLLEADGADGRDPWRGRGSGGGSAGGLVDEAFGPDPLLHGLDELLGLIAGDAEELPALLEDLEGGLGGGGLLAAGLLLGLQDAGRRGDEFLVGGAERLHCALHWRKFEPGIEADGSQRSW